MAIKAQFSHGDPVMEDHTPTADVNGGDVVPVGDVVHICHVAIPANRMGALAVRGGVYTSPKGTSTSSPTGTAIPKGKKVYWDATNNVVTLTATSNKQLGYTVDYDAGVDDTQVNFIHVPT